jgi:hypothetical protein
LAVLQLSFLFVDEPEELELMSTQTDGLVEQHLEKIRDLESVYSTGVSLRVGALLETDE